MTVTDTVPVRLIITAERPDFDAGVIDVVRTAPTPTLTLYGTFGTITGVRFLWPTYCTACRRHWNEHTDDGEIVLGVQERTGRPARWVERHLPKKKPGRYFRCPHCDASNNRFDGQRYPDPVSALTSALTDRAWKWLREQHPTLAAQADDNWRHAIYEDGRLR